MLVFMKHLYIPLLLALVGGSLNVSAQSKFNAADLQAVTHYRQTLLNPGAQLAPAVGMPFEIATLGRGTVPTASAFLTLSDGYDARDLEAYGLDVQFVIAGIAQVEGAVEDILSAADSDAVVAVEFSREVSPLLNQAREDTGVDLIQGNKATGLTQAYTGKGVVCGIFDSGVDPNHITFNEGTNGTETRVKRLWHFAGSNGTSTEYKTQTEIRSFVSDDQTGYHGTHTMGIMAGSYNGRGGTWANVRPGSLTCPTSSTQPNPYYGVATSAELAVGCGKLSTGNITAGVSKIVEYARSEGKPCVVNLSLGSVIGPHDGTDAASMIFKDLSKDAIICVAAGNEADMHMSFSRNLSPSSPVRTFIVPDPDYNTSANTGSGVVDIWFNNNESGATMYLAVASRSTGEILFKHPVDLTAEGETAIASRSYSQPSYIKDEAINNAFTRGYLRATVSNNASTNKRTNVYLSYDFTGNNSTNAKLDKTFAIIIEGPAGVRVDGTMNPSATAYTRFTSANLPGWVDGTADFSINAMACAEDVVAIGSYNTRDRWGSTNKGVYGYFADNKGNIMEGYEVGNVSPFSSYGILIDGRALPHVCAPGAAIVSATSTPYVKKSGLTDYVAVYNDTKGNRSNYWVSEQGTSMACPFAAGVIAMMLELNPELTAEQARNILKYTATNDNNVLTNGNRVQWVVCKLNAVEALKAAVDPSGVQGVIADSKQSMITPMGGNVWDVFVPGAADVRAEVYSVAGHKVASVAANGESLTVDLGAVAPGFYVISVNGGAESARILVK